MHGMRFHIKHPRRSRRTPFPDTRTPAATKLYAYCALVTAKYKKPNADRELKLPVVSMVKLNKVDEKVVSTLQAEGKELSLQELTDKTGEPSKKVFKSLKKLFENEIVSTQARKYKLTIVDTKAIKAKLAAKGDEEEPEA
jgi:hypothetical protein